MVAKPVQTPALSMAFPQGASSAGIRDRGIRTMGTVVEAPRATSRGQETRTRILDVAQESILAKGFDATSIEEIVAGADITRSGFFYHFPDKNALARALIERYLAEDRELLGGLFARANELSDDPLHAFLIGLKLLSETMADLPNGHPGCIVATVCYQERLFDAEVRELNRQSVLAWRRLFLAEIEKVAARYPPRDEVDLEELADMISSVIEGGIIVSKALREPRALARQILLQRSYIKLLFAP
jgi:AcrR family transcriptional regulator